MLLEQRRQAMPQLHLNDQQFYFLRCDFYSRFDGRTQYGLLQPTRLWMPCLGAMFYVHASPQKTDLCHDCNIVVAGSISGDRDVILTHFNPRFPLTDGILDKKCNPHGLQHQKSIRQTSNRHRSDRVGSMSNRNLNDDMFLVLFHTTGPDSV